MRQMMFARVFPATHPRKGELTRFPEKIWAGLADRTDHVMDHIDFGSYPMDFHIYYNAVPKYHTIRAGDRWKVGDWFTPRIWSGKPYNSKTIIFGPPLEVKKVWDIEICISSNIFIDGKEFCACNRLADNDGLSISDFRDWFPLGKTLDGQIICWNDKIEY